VKVKGIKDGKSMFLKTQNGQLIKLSLIFPETSGSFAPASTTQWYTNEGDVKICVNLLK
jgi:hypothetical protein